MGSLDPGARPDGRTWRAAPVTTGVGRNRGLSRRLGQHARRSGFAVGLAMAATVAIFVVGTAVIFARLQPLVGDFVSVVTPDAIALAGEAPPTPIVLAAASTPAPNPAGRQGEAPTPAPSTAPSPTPTPAAFAPDLRVNPAGATAVRLRAEPSTAGGETTIVDNLPPGTLIQATGTEEPSTDPSQPGVVWIEVRTATKQEGWIRRIDTVPNTP